MRGLGTAINVATVLLGGGIGLMLGAKLPERIQKIVLQCLGLFTIFIGIMMALDLGKVGSELVKSFPEHLGALARLLPALVMLASLVFGAVAGELLRIQDGLDALGEKLRQRFGKADGGRFTEGFVTTSLLFCVGPMTVMGCISDGLGNGFELLAIKSIMDGFSAMAFAAELGVGVMFSAGTVLVVQGALTFGARGLEQWLTEAMKWEMTAVGGLLIIGLGLGLLDIKKMKMANFLPALVFAPLLIWVIERLG
jgi:uncharacterized membrane protein YqgA involved in biofilm formation